MSVEPSEAERDAQAGTWATKFDVSVERMRSLIEAFGADEHTIAEVLRLLGSYKSRKYQGLQLEGPAGPNRKTARGTRLSSDTQTTILVTAPV